MELDTDWAIEGYNDTEKLVESNITLNNLVLLRPKYLLLAILYETSEHPLVSEFAGILFITTLFLIKCGFKYSFILLDTYNPVSNCLQFYAEFNKIFFPLGSSLNCFRKVVPPYTSNNSPAFRG